MELLTTTYTYDDNDRMTGEVIVTPQVSSDWEDDEGYYAAMPNKPSRWAGYMMIAFGAATLSAMFVPFGLFLPRRRAGWHGSCAADPWISGNVDAPTCDPNKYP